MNQRGDFEAALEQRGISIYWFESEDDEGNRWAMFHLIKVDGDVGATLDGSAQLVDSVDRVEMLVEMVESQLDRELEKQRRLARS